MKQIGKLLLMMLELKQPASRFALASASGWQAGMPCPAKLPSSDCTKAAVLRRARL